MLDSQQELLHDTNKLCLLLEGLECRKLSLVEEITELCQQCTAAPSQIDAPRLISVLPEEFAMILASRQSSLQRMREELKDIKRLREVLKLNIKNNERRETHE